MLADVYVDLILSGRLPSASAHGQPVLEPPYQRCGQEPPYGRGTEPLSATTQRPQHSRLGSMVRGPSRACVLCTFSAKVLDAEPAHARTLIIRLCQRLCQCCFMLVCRYVQVPSYRTDYFPFGGGWVFVCITIFFGACGESFCVHYKFTAYDHRQQQQQQQQQQ